MAIPPYASSLTSPRWASARRRACILTPRCSDFSAALAQHLAHDVADHGGKVGREAGDHSPQAGQVLPHAAHVLRQDVDLAFHAVKAGLDGSEIVAVVASLFENMARDQLFAFDLAFE